MKSKNTAVVILVTAFFLGISLWNVLFEPSAYSQSERRVLANFPQVSAENIVSGSFAQEFEDYAVDRFTARDMWRQIKAYAQTKVFMQKDNNHIFTVDEHISKLEYPLNKQMLDHALQLFSEIHERNLLDNNIYLAVIPDKNKYLAKDNGYLSIDYDAFSRYMANGMDYAQYIEISDLLDADDYYYTDTHWRQPSIVDVAERIADAMGADISQDYRVNQLDIPFNGVYAGQSALICQPDTITYLTNDITESASVEGASAIYDMEKASGLDPYEMFLSGNQPVISIKNSKCSSNKRLIMFRDSFGSSIAPLFIKGYSEIILVDLRYIPSDMLNQFVDFKNADILFLYSTTMLNNSLSIK